MALKNGQDVGTIEECTELMESPIPFEEKIKRYATLLRHAKADADRDLLSYAMECMVHLQFKYRTDRNYGIIVTEDEYWAIRNIVWNIDKGIFWNAIGKRMAYLYYEPNHQWLIFDDESNRWEGYDAVSFERVASKAPPSWAPWKRVLDDHNVLDIKWFEGSKTNLSFNSLDRYILEDPEPHYYRYWESESWDAEEPEETLRLNHREYLFEVTKTVMSLRNLGVRKQDRVALLMPEIPEAYYLLEAFHRMGVIYTSLPTSLGDQQVSDRIDNLDVKYVFTVNAGWHKGRGVDYKTDLLDRALSHFSKKEYVSSLLDALSKELSEKEFNEFRAAFKKRSENRMTVNKRDFLDFIENYGLSNDIQGHLRNKLDSEPERVSKVVVFRRIKEGETNMRPGRDEWWHGKSFMGDDKELEIISAASAILNRKMTRENFLDYKELSAPDFLKVIHRFSPPEIVEANEPRLVIYTSGSTGIPKGVVHRTLGHALFGMYTMLVTMGPRNWEVMDTRASHSWITGLDYIAGMPGLLGVETIIAEGAFDYERWLKRLSRLKVTISKAGAPVLRGIKKFGETGRGKKLLSELDLSSVRICVNCAEPADPVTQGAINEILGDNKYVNTWWPTELTGPNTGTGSATVPYAYEMKDDASTFPLPYVKQDIMDDEVDAEDNVIQTRPQQTDVLGRFVIEPHPGMLAGIYGDPEKFHDSYFKRYWNKAGNQVWYDSGDGATRHEDGYFHIIGRVGYAFNWNGHISGAEDVEGTLRDHPAVRDVMIAPIKNRSDNLDGLQVFVVLNEGYVLDDHLKQEFDDFVVHKKQRTFKGLMKDGSDYYIVKAYPVTVSQKSLRRFGSMLGSLNDKELRDIMIKLADSKTRALIEDGDETTISDVFPTRKEQNPYAGSLIGLGNYSSLIHLAHVVAEARGLTK